jgi:amino acid adenylation domain-containing protein
MKNNSKCATALPPEQEAIRTRCFHPTGVFTRFPNEDLERSIPDRFEQISRRYPDRIAVKVGAQCVSYSELNELANRIARTILAGQGHAAEPVALLFNNVAKLAAAMLGVLKAGKYFVLLDPLLPAARLKVILENSRAGLVIAERQEFLTRSGMIAPDTRNLLFETIASTIDSEDLRLKISAAALAYIVYTSGSTGHPKGVLQNHQNLLHRVLTRTNTRHLCADDRLTHLTAGTSNAITNACLALLNGATLVSFNAREEGPAALARWLASEEISMCRIGVPLFRRLCENLTGKENLSELRLIELTSDTIRRSDIDLFKKSFSRKTILITALSSTETGLLTECFLDHDSNIDDDDAPVGYPVEDKEIRILDDNGNEAGLNEIGEITVRSRFLSPGFWRNPELTSARFKSDPDQGEYKLYMTGDLGVILPDGCVVHKGRKDFRTKVRGYSIEISEVEEALRAHPDVKDAVVVSRQNEVGEGYLIAYFTSRGQPGPGICGLRDLLREKLPDYMVPSMFSMLNEIPLTRNGKVDRNALQAPSRTRVDVAARFVAPRTTVERQLAEIWQTVLSLDRVGIHDNFFQLGGHSLAATDVVCQIFQRFQLEISPKLFFDAPTVAETAAAIAMHQVKSIDGEELKSLLEAVESLSEEETARCLEEEVE